MEIIKEVTSIKEMWYVTSEQVVCWSKRVEVKGAHKALLETAKETKECKKLTI